MGEKYAKNARTLDMYSGCVRERAFENARKPSGLVSMNGRFKEISMISGPFWMSDRCREMGGR